MKRHHLRRHTIHVDPATLPATASLPPSDFGHRVCALAILALLVGRSRTAFGFKTKSRNLLAIAALQV